MIHVIGSGIQTYSHITKIFDGLVKNIDKVFFSVNEPITKEYILQLNKSAIDLDDLYFSKDISSRLEIYNLIADEVINSSKNDDVVYVDYGHPSVINKIVQILVQKSIDNDIPINVYPGISAEDCLFADLKISPDDAGWMSFEATGFLHRKVPIYPHAHLILWQVGFINARNKINDLDKNICEQAFKDLISRLINTYGEKHEVIIYEASQYPQVSPKIERYKLSSVLYDQTTTLSTMYIAPL